jgi:hypothetical protein
MMKESTAVMLSYADFLLFFSSGFALKWTSDRTGEWTPKTIVIIGPLEGFTRTVPPRRTLRDLAATEDRTSNLDGGGH